MKRKYLVGTLIIFVCIIICVLYFKPTPPTQTTLFQNSHSSNDVLILYKNDKKTALTLTTNTNSISPIIYFDVMYTKIVESNGTYYLTDDTDFLKINQNGTVEKSAPLSTYQPVTANQTEYLNPLGNEGFVYKQKNNDMALNTDIVIPHTIFKLEGYQIIQIIQVNDYFS